MMNRHDRNLLIGIVLIFLAILCATFVVRAVQDMIVQKAETQKVVLENVYDTPSYKVDNIEYCGINDGWYEGCAEYACGVMLLSAYDRTSTIPMLLEATTFSKDDKDFVYKYIGDINSEGVIYPKGLVITINKYLSRNKDYGKIHAQNISHEGWSYIRANVDLGIPVACWVTKDMQEPEQTDKTFENYTLYKDVNCVVITDINQDGDSVTYLDPYNNRGKKSIDIATFVDVWEKCGGMAMKIDSATI